jgi:hypothetical protein
MASLIRLLLDHPLFACTSPDTDLIKICRVIEIAHDKKLLSCTHLGSGLGEWTTVMGNVLNHNYDDDQSGKFGILQQSSVLITRNAPFCAG